MCLNDDIKPLEKLKEKVDGVIKTEKYIRKAAFMNLSKSLYKRYRKTENFRSINDLGNYARKE